MSKNNKLPEDEGFTFTEVKGVERNKFLSDRFGSCLFDILVFSMAGIMLEGYEGGYWDYMDVNDSGMGDNPQSASFLMLAGDNKSVVTNPHSGESFEMGDALAGMILTSYTIANLHERNGDNGLLEKLYDLNGVIRSYCSRMGRMDVWMGLMD